MNSILSKNPLTILLDSRTDDGHYWQIASNFRRVFLESQRDFVFFNPKADLAFQEDLLLFPDVDQGSYREIGYGENFFDSVLVEVDGIVKQDLSREVEVIFLWLPDVMVDELQAYLDLSDNSDVSISGISFSFENYSTDTQFSFESEFRDHRACKRLWVWSEISHRQRNDPGTKLRRLPEYHPSTERLSAPLIPTIGFFGKLNSSRGLPEVLLIALFNRGVRIKIKGYGYESDKIWRASKCKFLIYSSGRRKPWAAIVSKILNRFYSLLLHLPNVYFDPIPFPNQIELQKAIATCSATFYAAKLPFSSGVALTSLASGTPLIWSGLEGEAVRQFTKAFPEGRIKTWEIYIPRRIERKLSIISLLKPREIYTWKDFRDEVLNIS